MKKRNKVMISVIGLIVISMIVSISYVSAYQRLCLTYGQSVPSEEIQRYTCDHDSCQICVTNSLYPTKPSRCNDIDGCSAIGNGSNIDQEPPVLVINSPLENGIYDSTSVLFDLTTDELSSIYYIDNINGKGRWNRIASNVKNLNKAVRLNEGLNDLTIKAVDRHGNAVEIVKKFRIDTKKPKITKTLPSKGFASGNFEVQFQENNPESLILNYGNDLTGLRNAGVDLSKCTENQGKVSCMISVNLDDYDGQEIEYWFSLSDIAGNSAESKPIILDVDSSDPVINNVDYEINGKNVYFIINVDEDYLSEVGYEENGKEKKLCSSLKNGVCEGKATFKDGDHNILIYVKDKAGHRINKPLTFFTDSQKPKITKADTDFLGGYYIQFKEDNPVALLLHFGNDATGYQTYPFNLVNDCSVKSGKYSCEAHISYGQYLAAITPYKDQTIKYWFELIDRAGSNYETKKQETYIDITPPVINNPGNFWEQGEGRNSKYVYFNIDITEENLDEVSYVYVDNNGITKENKLCSSLRNGFCTAKKSFKNGEQLLNVVVKDESGNYVVGNIGLTVEY